MPLLQATEASCTRNSYQQYPRTYITLGGDMCPEVSRLLLSKLLNLSCPVRQYKQGKGGWGRVGLGRQEGDQGVVVG